MEISATYLLQLMLNGLMLGLIYALVAVGLALIFGVLEVINFTHGELLTPHRENRPGLCLHRR
jgi:branched-chain amino acid transport system permease protein